MEPPRTPSAERRRREEERKKVEEEKQRLEAEARKKQIMARLIFHDFDYINPLSNLPEGDIMDNAELRH